LAVLSWAGELVVGGLFEIAGQGRRDLPAAGRRRTAAGHVGRGRLVFGRALPDLGGLLAQPVLEVALDIVERVVADEMLEALGMLVEFPVKLLLPGQELVQARGQLVAFVGVGLGRLLFELPGRIAEPLLVLEEFAQIVREGGVLGLGIRQVGLPAKEIVVVLDADHR
jgi:hypothetical protein